MDKHALLAAARAFRAALEQATDAALDGAYRTLAQHASDSDYAQVCEPLSWIAQAVLAERTRRDYNRLGDASDYVDASDYGRERG